MIRFNILGVGELELPDNFSVQFSYNNSLFAFDNMQLSRTTEFDVPATPNNNKLLGFAGDPSNDGYFLRRRLQAQMYTPGGAVQGVIYFNSFEGGMYKCIFVYGELVKFVAIKELGKISNYINVPDTLTTTPPHTILTSYYADGKLPFNFAWYKYFNGISSANIMQGGVNYSPTVKLAYLLNTACSRVGITLDTTAISEAYNGIGIILQGNSKETRTTCTFSGVPTTTLNVTGGAGYLLRVSKTFKYSEEGALYIYGYRVLSRRSVYCFEAQQNMTIKPTATTKSLYVLTGDGRQILAASPITGKEIQLSRGEYFTFCETADLFMGQPWKSQTYTTDIGSVTCEVWSETDSEVAIGDTYYLRDNLPEVTAMDLIKTVANITGTGVSFDNNLNKLTFFDYNFSRLGAKELDDIVIEYKGIKRTFLDYAKSNDVTFDNDSYVNLLYNISYRIDNGILADNKVVFNVPFSSGNNESTNSVVVRDFSTETPPKKLATKSTIAVASKVASVTTLRHISQLVSGLNLGANLRNIIANSTTIELVIKMTLSDFMKMGNKDTFRYRGRHYVCASGSYSDNTATLVLIQI